MCDQNIVKWFTDAVKNHPEHFHNKVIIEVGSKFVNESVRPIIINYGKPCQYIGVDISKGKYVDMVVPAEKLVETFGEKAFDIVISTEMLEHVYDWKIVIENLKRILKEEGTILVTTRSFGCIYHGFPFDFWRFEPEDMKHIFADFKIEFLHYDNENIGVWLKAKKPIGWKISELNYPLYSIAIGKHSSVPRNISFSRKLLAIVQSSLFSMVYRSSEGTSGANSPAGKNTSFSRRLILILRRSGLIM